MLNDKLNISGKLIIKLYNENGEIKEEKTIPNLIVTTGKNWIASRMQANTPSVMTHMSIGTGSGQSSNVARTTLISENGKVALANTGGYTTDNSITFNASFPAGTGTGSLTEAGIFNASAGNTGTMLCRTEFGTVTKGASDAMTISWVVSIT